MATVLYSAVILASISLTQGIQQTIISGSDVLANATSIHLENNVIEYLPDFAFSNYTTLERLYLTSNLITNISLDAFTNTSLNYLYLDDNLLTRIPNLTNVGATLGKLDLSDNQIRQIEPADF
jgi:Leucine-rich repeat (LRR) protein